MEKTIRLFGLVAALGAGAIIIAQQGSVRDRTSGATSTVGDPIAAAQGAQKANGVLEVMSQYFNTKHNYLIEKAKADGTANRIDGIVRMNCAASLWLLSPDGQKKEMKSWQMDRFVPSNADWQAVSRTPSLVRHLFKVDAATSKKAHAILDLAWKPITDYTKQMTDRIVETPEYKAARTQDERMQVAFNFYQKHGNKATILDRSKAAADRHAKAVTEVRQLLKGEQRAEFDAIISRYDKAIQSASEGRTPIPQ